MTIETKVTVTFKREEREDCHPDLSYLTQDYRDVTDPTERAKYMAQDQERLLALQRGDWTFIGIRAKAEVRVTRGSYTTIYNITSPGLWGIESDCDEASLAEIFQQECDNLSEDIKAFGAATFPGSN